MRDMPTLARIAGEAKLLVDVAFYNAPVLVPLARQHRDATLFVIFRRCEGFVRSATIVSGEDLQPAGWPDRAKSLTDREQFIALGRLKPKARSTDAVLWSDWSAIERNIWLWHRVNSHLLRVVETHANCHALHYEELAGDLEKFWADCLHGLDIVSESNLERCVALSTRKINQRPSYQVGSIDTWGDAEVALFDRVAQPLEKKICG